MNFYNENNPKAARWLRELIKAGLIAPGVVDERSITELDYAELKQYTQCHFFAGIGGWSLALRLAGWPDNEPVWTGSCPCQPFSAAGKRKGKADDRHLWPVWFSLIRKSRPPIVFGEQVSAAIRHGWWDDVADDLEGEGYTARAEIRPACSVGAPHRRDRLWFVAHAEHDGSHESSERGGNEKTVQHREEGSENTGKFARGSASRDVSGIALAHAECKQDDQEPQRPAENERGRMPDNSGRCGMDSEQANVIVADAISRGQQGQGTMGKSMRTASGEDGKASHAFDAGAGFWNESEWIECADGKSRLVKPGLPLLADGVPNRVAKLHGLGNAIVPQVAAAFITAARDFLHF